jgi:hypothetical protein
MGDNATRTRYPLVGSKDAVSAKSVGMLPATETEWQARGCGIQVRHADGTGHR